MSQTLGSNGKVRWNHPKNDRLDPERVDKDVRRIVALVVVVRQRWEQAVDGASYPGSGPIGGSRHTGFEDNDPTHAAATRPTQRQLRGSARFAASEIAAAADRLESAIRVLDNGLFRTDPDEWIQHQEKRGAATQHR